MPALRESKSVRRGVAAALGFALPLLASGAAWADDAPKVIDSGDTAWVLASTALVLMMTLPGLALFYGGLVRAKNVLNIFMQCFIAAGAGRRALGAVRLQPGLRADGGGSFVGNLDKACLTASTLTS